MSYESKTGQPLTEEEKILHAGILREAFDSVDYILHRPMIMSIAEKSGYIGTAIEMRDDLAESLNDPLSE